MLLPNGKNVPLTYLGEEVPLATTFAAGQAVSAEFDPGDRLLGVLVRLADGSGVATDAEMKAQVGNAELVLAGKSPYKLSGTPSLDLFRGFYNPDFPLVGGSGDGLMYIPVAPDPRVLRHAHARNGDWFETETLGIGTRGFSARLQVKIHLTGSVTITNGTIQPVWMEDSSGPGDVLVWREKTINLTSTGDHLLGKEIDRLPSTQLVAVHLYGYGSGVVNNVEVKGSQRNFWPGKGHFLPALDKINGRVPQSGYVHIDLASRNRIGAAPPWGSLANPDFVVNWSTAPSAYQMVICTKERWGEWAGLIGRAGAAVAG